MAPDPAVMLALPASEPIVLLKVLRARVPPLTVTALLTPKAPDTGEPLVSTVATPACRMPAETVVLPL